MDKIYCVPIEALIYLKIIVGCMVALVMIWLLDSYYNIRSNAALNKNARIKLELLQAEMDRLKAEIAALKRRHHG